MRTSRCGADDELQAARGVPPLSPPPARAHHHSTPQRTCLTSLCTAPPPLPPPHTSQDMLDLAFEPTDSSRLGCQVVLSPEVEGLVVYLPRGFNNIMDNIPFEDGESLGRGA